LHFIRERDPIKVETEVRRIGGTKKSLLQPAERKKRDSREAKRGKRGKRRSGCVVNLKQGVVVKLGDQVNRNHFDLPTQENGEKG